MMTRRYAVAIAVSLLTTLGPGQNVSLSGRQGDQADQSVARSSSNGSTNTRLADGRWLLVGGQSPDGPLATAWLFDPAAQTSVALPEQMSQGRAGHTATLLADGTVLLLGGRNGAALVEVPEVFNPATGTFTLVPLEGAARRVSHTATLLTDGRVLVAGGDNGGPIAVATEVWDLTARTATSVDAEGLNRSGHTATLMADGRVLMTGGRTIDGTTAPESVAIHPLRGTTQPVPAPADERSLAPAVVESIPARGATGVPLDTHIALRFSTAMNAASLSPDTVSLAGPEGVVPVHVIPAEQGRLAFVWPATRLSDDSTYTLTLSGAVDGVGTPLTPTTITFTTVRPTTDAGKVDPEEWAPDAATRRNGWRSNRAPSPWETTAPLLAPLGVSAVSGRVLRLDGRPLADVTLRLEGQTTRSDRTGRFLLRVDSLATGEHTLVIDARTANRPARTYGFYEARIGAYAGKTTVLPFTIWSPVLDTAHAVTIPSPTTAETVITTPTMPGLELHLPAGTVITDEDHHVVRTVSLTPIPLDRTPFPMPADATFTMFFTIQPGGAYLATSGPIKGGWLVYPNARQSRVGKRVQFFNYDPDDKGWYPYGMGTVTRTQVVPDATTRIYAFTGASFNDGSAPPAGGGTPGSPKKADPVDPSTGAFIMTKTDLSLPDVMPLTLTRTYNAQDAEPRAFGIGMTHNYAVFTHSENFPVEADLIQPDGGRIHYARTSDPVLPWWGTVFEHTATPTRFYKSRLTFWGGILANGGWQVAQTDGMVYVFGHMAPLQAIRDRYGNETRLTWSDVNTFGSGTGNLLRVTSPNGRWIAFTYDTGNRVTQATDTIGRTVAYAYDGSGRLSTVTDPENNVTTYTWDTSNRLLTIRDGRDIVYLTNEYTSGRVTKQTLADPNATYQLSYTVDGTGNITQTDITDPRGQVERLAFNSNHYIVSETAAFGTSLARTTTTERQTGTNLVTAVTDGLNRRSEFTYDGTGHALTIARLAGTANAVTATLTYEPSFHQLATVTDPLSHTWGLTYDTAGVLTGVTDPLGHHTTLALNSAGQLTRVTDPLSHAWQFGYTGGDRTSTTNPLNAQWTQFVDAGGRMVSATDPLGRLTRGTVDKLNRPTAVTDALGGQTSFTYDGNNNLLSMTDALTHATSYTYDTSDRVATQTDPLTHQTSYAYDVGDHLTQTTDRKSQVTSAQYDALDRPVLVTYHDTSTIAYTYDAGDRITQIVDSANGAIAREYDLLNRLTSETTPQGTISYTYDADGRRATMTVLGQPAVSYAYDDANRLTSVTQGASSVTMTYDEADRRSTVTYPNGIVATSWYDNANQLASLSYASAQTTLGTFTYTYDAAGQRTSVGGTWARTGVPAALTSATYDAANRIVTWNGTSFSYDLNGNLTNDGTLAYTWDARNQLAGLSGGMSASFEHDGSGRRSGKTISGTTTNFLYDGLNFVQEQTSNGTPIANLVTGLSNDETFTRVDGSGTSHLLTDPLGGTIALTNGSGAVQTSYTYDPFGTTSTSGSTSANAGQFTGRENDGTGLYYYRARFYSPQIQRFVSEDPSGFAGGLNLFVYANNAPTVFADPLGLKPSPGFGQPPRIGAPPPPRIGAPRPRVPTIGAPPPPKPGNPPRVGPAPHCDAFCRMIGDAAQRAAPMADPLTYVELPVAAAIGGVVGATLPGAISAAGNGFVGAMDAAANAAIDLQVTFPNAINVIGGVAQGYLPGMPPPTIPGLIGAIIGKLWP
jgi:RHS repeat-associated protein